jgi:hypothetical protein
MGSMGGNVVTVDGVRLALSLRCVLTRSSAAVVTLLRYCCPQKQTLRSFALEAIRNGTQARYDMLQQLQRHRHHGAFSVCLANVSRSQPVKTSTFVLMLRVLDVTWKPD